MGIEGSWRVIAVGGEGRSVGCALGPVVKCERILNNDDQTFILSFIMTWGGIGEEGAAPQDTFLSDVMNGNGRH